MLELINVSYLDGDRRIVDTVDLEIEAGSVVVLLGPRGAGKTTLLRLISGELEPTSGFVVRDPRVSLSTNPATIRRPAPIRTRGSRSLPAWRVGGSASSRSWKTSRPRRSSPIACS
jgi:ABC-type hemin transport system ATPase subunit